MRKGEIRAGGGTGTMGGNLEKDWNEGVQSKHRVHMSKWKASRKCQYAIFQLPQVIEFKYLGSTLQSNGDMHIISGHEDTVWIETTGGSCCGPMRH